MVEANLILNNIQASVPTAFIVVDRDLRLRRYSPLAVKTFGFVEADIGTPMTRLPPNFAVDDFVARIDQVIKTGSPLSEDVSGLRGDYLMQVVPYISNGETDGAVVALTDISELAEVRRELSQSAEAFRAMADAIPSAVFRRLPGEATFDYLSDGVEAIVGISAEEANAEPELINTFIHKNDRDRVLRLRRSGGEFQVDYRLLGSDGALRTIREVSRSVFHDSGQHRFSVGTIVDITDLDRARHEAEQARSKFEVVFTRLATATAELGDNGSIIMCNEAFARLLHRTTAELVGRELSELCEPEDGEGLLERLRHPPTNGVTEFRAVLKERNGPARPVEVLLSGVPARSSQPGSRAVSIAAFRDLSLIETERSKADSLLRRSQALFKDSGAAMATATLSGVITSANDAMVELTGFEPEQLVGQHLLSLTPDDDPTDEGRLLAAITEGRSDSYSVARRIKRANGDRMWVRTQVHRLPPVDGEQGVLLQTNLDISAEKHAEGEALRRAQIDPLTGLMTRVIAFDRLEQTIKVAEREGGTVAVLYLDLDDFKSVNDVHGHHAGDELLRSVGRRLKTAGRASDTTARLGGDEFLIVAPQGPGGEYGAADMVARVEESLRATTPTDLGGQGAEADVEKRAGTPTSTASIGVAVFPEDGQDAEELIQRADAAMYTAKQAGGNRTAFYSASIQSVAEQRSQMRSRLLAAFERSEFVPYFQPILDCQSGQPVGLELLARWIHPERGILGPPDFLSWAEQFKFEDDLTKSVLAHAVKALAELRRHHPDLTISVNVSTEQLADPDFFSRVGQTIGEDWSGWTLEVHGNSDSDQAVVISRAIAQIKDLGGRASLDNFGGDHASVANLRRFAVDEVKLDRALVAECRDPAARRLVRAISDMSHALGAVVVAGGVEDQETKALLHDLGADRAQGHIYAPPAALSATLDWLREHRSDT